MKRICYIVLIAMVLILLKTVCYAVDPSIYDGTWKTRNGKPVITIIIKSEAEVTLEINKKLIGNLEFDFCYCNVGAMPFFCLLSEDGDFIHYLYFTIGSTRKMNGLPDYDVLKGFYELSKFVEPEREKLDIKYYPVELFRVKD